MPQMMQCPVCEAKFRYKARKKFCSPNCKAKFHYDKKEKRIENLKNQLLEKKKPQEIEPPKIDNAEVQKLNAKISELNAEILELKKEIENKNLEIKNLKKNETKLKASNEKFKLELKKAKQPPANLKSRLIIYKCYLELTKRIEYRLRKDNKIDENEHKQKIISLKNRMEIFKKTIDNATAEQIFFSYYEYEGKGDEVSKKIKLRLELLESESGNYFYWDYIEKGKRIHKYSKLEVWECLRDCGIENYQKQDADLFFKYYDLPKK